MIKQFLMRGMYDIKAVIISLIVGFLVVTFVISRTAVVEVLESPTEPMHVEAGKQYTLCRKVEYLRDADLEMSKILIKNISDQEYITINFPIISFRRTKGVQTICRTMMLPPYMTQGLWELKTYINAKTFPFWERQFETPIVWLVVDAEK